MKLLLLLTFFFLCTTVSATDYYISASGNDANTGLSTSTPWKTIAKVNSKFANMKPGDQILFNRGDTFYGSLVISKSGTSGSPITLGAYGAGEKPIITGFTSVTAWTNLGNNIWESTNAVSALSTCNMVLINGMNTPMGRYPNTGYLTYQSHSGNTSITSSSLSGTPNWTGAEAVIRKERWILDRNSITSQSGGTLIYSGGGYNGKNNYGFFIQNDSRTLDQQNEWYYNPLTKKIRLYSPSMPLNVNLATISTLVTILYKSYITLDGVAFNGANSSAINIGSCINTIINNCSIDFCYDGILGQDYGTSSANFKLLNSTINHINNTGMTLSSEFYKSNVTNNIIKNVGLIAGLGGSGDGKYQGMIIKGIKSLIEYNELDSCGYIGMGFMSDSAIVNNNIVNYFCLTKDDGSGIYFYTSTGSIASQNIVLNGLGCSDGTDTSYKVYLNAHGIYLDDNTHDAKILNNSVSNICHAGIYLHSSNNITVTRNNIYNSGESLMISSDNLNTYVTKIKLDSNIFISKTAEQITYKAISVHNDITNFGFFNNNYYARPIDDNLVFLTNPYGQSDTPGQFFTYNLSTWKAYSNQDANSKKSPISIINTADIDFYLNESKVNRIISLKRPMIDIKGLKYTNSILLLPFTSIVLMVDPNPILPPVPVYASAAVGNATPSLIEMTYDLSLANIAPATSAFSVLVNSAVRAVNAVAISGTKVQLTLASAIAFGDVLTVDYTKPAVSPLQTTSAGLAASVTAQAVTNNISAPVPVYVSAAVGNTAPSKIEMTYDLSLANIVPATSAFSVLVNSAARAVNAVAISGTKVQITLASAIAFGDVVTVAYTKPALNPLQTSSAGMAASVTAQAVTNSINPPVPVYVTSAVGNATPSLIEMTYSLNLANIIPATSAFTVLVNAAARAVNTVAISGTKVQLTLASAIAFGDVVTVAYTKPAASPLQTTSAGQAESVTAQTVTNSINPPVPVYVTSAVGNATPSLIEMTYSLNLANIIPATSAFSVLVNSAARAVNAVAISGNKVQLTLASAIAFGDVVTVAYTKPVVSPLQTISAGLAASITAQAVTNSINPPVPLNISSAVGNVTPSVIEMTYNLGLANIVPATSAFSVLVNSAARAVNTVVISGTKVQLTLSSAIAFGDVVTVAYTKPAVSPLQTSSAGQAASVTAKAVTNNISVPVPVSASAAVGNTTPSLVEMTYNLSLANIVPATSAFSVLVNSAVRAVNTVAISGTKVQLTLTSGIAFGDVVTVAYTKPATSPLQTTSAGQAASVNAQAVANNILAPVPVYISAAVGNTAPLVLEITYSLSLANIAPATSAFSVLVNSAAKAVNAVAISGTKVQLTLASAIAFGDVVTVAYTKPAVNPLQTSSEGLAVSITAQAVTNNISAPVPVYASAAVGNATPSLLEMTYSLSLTNIVPATSAFTVLVNAAARAVNTVAISGTKVQLTLASAIAFGDVVTVAYTKPAVSPLQTTSAGQAASVNAQAVTNSTNPKGINGSHFVPVWQGENGTNHMNLIVVSATLENLPLSADDEIAVFSGSICVGSMILTKSINAAINSTFLVIPASQDDGSNNGFINNDSIIFKIWDHTNQREMGTNVVNYKNDIPTWLTSGKYSAGATSVVEIATFTENIQTIALLQGYNLISTYISPDDPNVSTVAKQLMDQGELIKIQDEAGNSFENWGSFGGWVNKIGSFESTEGYKIKVANNCTIRVSGRPIVLPLDIPLKSGWNIISFPRTDLVDAMDIIQSLIDQNKLIKVQDEAGNSIENWGIFGGWKNAIGNFIPGKAYKVKSNADAVITIHENYLKSATIPVTVAKAEYFLTKIEGNGTDHMNINIVGLQEAGISIGDELAAFDGDVCVGSLKITKNQMIDGTAGLVASALTDAQKPDGFKEGSIIRIVGWNKSTNKEFQVQPELLNGKLNYQKEASVLVRMKALTPDAKIIDDRIKTEVYPNPCNGNFTVRLSAIPEAGGRIAILDISGRNILSRGILETAEEFNLDHQQPGIYIVKTIIGSSQTNHKLIIY
ncbi:MAG TPA: SwmB domain-containing protein [Prolixibacteraceae bacterium]|nr:SwmB domain-containing protein [Prolixibacteraceae bacterium]